MTRERLVRRIEMEAHAYVNAKGSSRDAMILGRVYGLLEAGTLEGYWRKRDDDSAGELVANRYRVSRIRDILLRDDEVALWRVCNRSPRFADLSVRLTGRRSQGVSMM